MSHYWWKTLSALLVLATIIFGLRTPLAPGIAGVSPEQLSYGATSVTITGYNTHFKEAENSLEIWASNGEANFCPYERNVLDDTHVRVSFSVTEDLANAFFDLHVANKKDGRLFFSSAFLQNGLEVSNNPDNTEDCVGEVAKDPGLFNFPNQPILNETIRNLLFHVPSWFAMMVVMGISLVFSIMYLNTSKFNYDISAEAAAHVGLLFAFIGLATGSIWARFTWSSWWINDPRLNGAALAVLIYLAYFVLKSSITDKEKAGRLAAVYNIFAFVMMVFFIMIYPRMKEYSLHPGMGGNPAFSQYDLDNNMRMVFYPAVLGWIGMSVWIYEIRTRIMRLGFKKFLNDAR
jgi:heme exporter protein C